MKLRLGAMLLLTVVCLAAALWGVPWADVAGLGSRIEPVWVLAMLGFYLLTDGLRALRLGVLLPRKVRWGRLFRITAIGFLAINVVPLRLGEFVRPYLLAEREGVPFGEGLAAILVERLLDMAMLLGMLFTLTWVIELPDAVLVEGVDLIGAGQRTAGLLLVGGVAAAGGLILGGPFLERRLARVPGGARIAALAGQLRGALLELGRRPLRALGLLGLSATIWACVVAAVACAMTAFGGLPQGIGPAWTAWTITMSGMLVLPTPGFFGAYELACSSALWLWSVPMELARVFAIFCHLGQFGYTVGLGLGMLALEGLSLGAIVRASRQVG